VNKVKRLRAVSRAVTTIDVAEARRLTHTHPTQAH
jgi:hypothetical protein